MEHLLETMITCVTERRMRAGQTLERLKRQGMTDSEYINPFPEDPHESWAEDLGECIICGEHVWSDNDPAEMYDAEMLADPEMYSEARAGLVHAQCGLDKGWKIA